MMELVFIFTLCWFVGLGPSFQKQGVDDNFGGNVMVKGARKLRIDEVLLSQQRYCGFWSVALFEGRVDVV